MKNSSDSRTDARLRARYKGALQPARESVFEPFIFDFTSGHVPVSVDEVLVIAGLSPAWSDPACPRDKALARLDAPEPRYGAKRSPVMEEAWPCKSVRRSSSSGCTNHHEAPSHVAG